MEVAEPHTAHRKVQNAVGNIKQLGETMSIFRLQRATSGLPAAANARLKRKQF